MKRMRKWFGSLLDAPPASPYYVDSADGFRVVCVLLVMWFHIWQQSWLSPSMQVGSVRLSIEPQVRTGYMAVDLMLLLSGFLLFLPFARNRVMGKRFERPRLYYLKRALRIIPCYYLCVFIVLFGFALPRGEYGSTRHLWLDLLSHLTFTHNLLYEGYLGTHLNGALWTLAVEVQFYLLLPLLGRAFAKKPALTWLMMTAAALAYRAWYLPTRDNFSMYFNRLPAMLDVYANGMMASLVYVSLTQRLKESDRATGVFFTVVALLSACLVFTIMRLQNGTASQIGTQPGQVYWRWRLSLCGALFLVAGGHASGWLRRLLSNRVTRFLSAISFNAYMWHQYLSIQLKVWRIPPYLAESMPQKAGEQPWMTQYTWLCFLGAVALAAFFTYAVEKPVYRLGEKYLLAPLKRRQRRRAKPD